MGLDGAAGPIGEWLPAQATQMVDRYQSDNLHTPPPVTPTPVPAAPPPYAPPQYAPAAYAPAPQFPPTPAPRGPRKTWPRWAGIAAIGLAATVVFGLVLALNSGPSDPSAPSASAAGARRGALLIRGQAGDRPQRPPVRHLVLPHRAAGPLFLEPASGTTTGYIKSSSNWFVCQKEGAANPKGSGTTWLYTQGDDRYKNGGWGWFPASSVSPTWADQPVPDIPACTF